MRLNLYRQCEKYDDGRDQEDEQERRQIEGVACGVPSADRAAI